jgi:hypothetical protein
MATLGSNSLWIVARRERENYAPGNWACEDYWECYSRFHIFSSRQDAVSWIEKQPGPILPIHFEFCEPRFDADGCHWRVMEVRPGVEIDLRK